MAGDGVKTPIKKRQRSQRNKIVSVITAVGGIATTLDQTVPGVVPPGVGTLIGQLCAAIALAVNQFWAK